MTTTAIGIPTPTAIFFRLDQLLLLAGWICDLTAGATSFYGGAGLRFKPAIRVTAFAMVDYVAPFQVRKEGPRYGEFAPQLGLGFTWP